MKKNLRHLLIITFLLIAYRGYAQEATVSYPDSIKLDLPKPILIENELNNFDQINLKFPRLNPAEKLQPQFSPFQRFNLTPTNYTRNGILPDIHWNGVASDFIFSKSRTAVATAMLTRRLLLHSSATLGIIETPFFGKANFYSINADRKSVV